MLRIARVFAVAQMYLTAASPFSWEGNKAWGSWQPWAGLNTRRLRNIELSTIQLQVQWCLLSDGKVASQVFDSLTGWCTRGLGETAGLNMEQNCFQDCHRGSKYALLCSLQVEPTQQQLTLAHGLKVNRAKWQRMEIERLGQQQGFWGMKSILYCFSLH